MTDEQIERALLAAESIAHSFAIIAMVLMREDEAEARPKNPLATLDDEPEL